MNIIKGLLLKDLYVFRNFKGNIIFSIFMFIFLIFIGSLRMDMFMIGSILFLIFFGMNSISSFSYDENADSDKYLLSLPITRKEIVLSKYLFVFLDAFISLIAGMLVSLFITILVRGSVDNIGTSLRICFIVFTSTSFLMCSNVPCIYKWGVEKGRMQSVIIPALFVFALGMIGSMLLVLFPGLYLNVNLEYLFQISPLICLILNILFYSVSYLISYKIYIKKEIEQ